MMHHASNARRVRIAMAVSLALSPLTTAVSAQQAAPPATRPAATQPATRPGAGNGAAGVIRQPGGGILLNFKDASIDAVLDELSAVAGFVVVKEVTRLDGKVTLVSKQPLNSEEAVALLNTVLRNNNYAAVQMGRILKIIPRDRAKKANIPVRSGSDPSKIEQTDELITQVIPIRYADATQLRQDLAPLINTAEADFSANASSNSLMITDTSANIRRVVEIVSALDTSLASDAAEVKVHQLKFASAASAARLINEIFRQEEQEQQGRGQQGGFPFAGFGGGGDRGRGSRTQQGQGAPRRQARVNASSDERTNTVVVSGPPETLKIVETVLKQIDSDPIEEQAVFVYSLRNAQALQLEAVVNNLFNGGGISTGGVNRTQTGRTQNRNTPRQNMGGGGGLGGGGGRGGGGGLGGGGGQGGSGGLGQNRPLQQLQQQGGGFSGGFGGGFGAAAGPGAQVSPTAVRTASTLAGEVTVVADPDTNSLLVMTNPKNFERVKAVIQELDRPMPQVLIKVLIAEVTHDNSRDLGTEFSILNLGSDGTPRVDIGTTFGQPQGGRGLVVRLVETEVQATIHALETAGKLDVLSRPYILASDNQLASITVGEEVPFITSSRITEEGQIINTLQYDDIGILLDVIPHINPDGLVIMDVMPEISALTSRTVPITNDVGAPIIAKRSAQTRVAIKNGHTIVIGGLMQDQLTDTVDKVPILGDIPLLGLAFQRKQTKNTKTELLIFITPHVAAEPGELKAMSEDEAAGTKLVPKAVAPGAFQKHHEGLQRGATRPSQ